MGNVSIKESSVIKDIEYHNGTMIVEFVRGGKYEYSDVPEFVPNVLSFTESVGTVFAKIVRNNYPFTRVQ